jgi:hypothetical protein
MKKTLICIILLLLSACSLGCPKFTYDEQRCQVAESAINSYKNQLAACKLELQISRMR